MSEQRPLCFVLMPFGSKQDDGGRSIDFDSVYHDLIAPAIKTADLRPIRADEEVAGGIIHKPMFERLLMCDYAVADLTTANANVYYELGIRHATRPHTTVPIFADGFRLPFDLGPVRGMPYSLSPKGQPANATSDQRSLAVLLREAQHRAVDSPLFQLVDGMQPPDISRLKTDVFREQVDYSEDIKEQLASAREQGIEAIRSVKAGLGSIAQTGSGILVDLMLSFRAVKAWDDLTQLVEEMPEPLARSVMVREQYALALNRLGRSDKAERVLTDLLKLRGPSSETYGILGRVYKDRWQEARDSGSAIVARGFLAKATDAYLKGFETDWRDAYPGINAVTLMELAEPPDPRRQELLPVVTYSVRRRIESGEPDYWDHATLLELAVLGQNQAEAETALANALAAVREVWEPETTLRNLQLISQTRESRGTLEPWTLEVEHELEKAMEQTPSL